MPRTDRWISTGSCTFESNFEIEATSIFDHLRESKPLWPSRKARSNLFITPRWSRWSESETITSSTISIGRCNRGVTTACFNSFPFSLILYTCWCSSYRPCRNSKSVLLTADVFGNMFVLNNEEYWPIVQHLRQPCWELKLTIPKNKSCCYVIDVHSNLNMFTFYERSCWWVAYESSYFNFHMEPIYDQTVM